MIERISTNNLNQNYQIQPIKVPHQNPTFTGASSVASGAKSATFESAKKFFSKEFSKIKNFTLNDFVPFVVARFKNVVDFAKKIIDNVKNLFAKKEV